MQQKICNLNLDLMWIIGVKIYNSIYIYEPLKLYNLNILKDICFNFISVKAQSSSK